MSDKRKYFYYKGIRVNSFGIPVSRKANYKSNVIKRKLVYNISFSSSLPENSSKNLIVMYDIPHEKKKERDWFRRHLKKFGYIMIQKSVWVGPSPLPKEFLDYVKDIGLKTQLKAFKLAKSYTSKSNNL